MLTVTAPGTLLAGWRSAASTAALLQLLPGPELLRPLTAVLHAAPDRHEPGTAALCGLARTLHTEPRRRARMVAAVRATAAALSTATAVRASERHALRAVQALAEGNPGDPAALAPLFLTPHQVSAGTVLDVLPGAPVLLLDGRLEVAPGSEDAELVVGGLGRGTDVTGFTAALRPGRWHDAPARPAVPGGTLVTRPA